MLSQITYTIISVPCYLSYFASLILNFECSILHELGDLVSLDKMIKVEAFFPFELNIYDFYCGIIVILNFVVDVVCMKVHFIFR